MEVLGLIFSLFVPIFSLIFQKKSIAGAIACLEPFLSPHTFQDDVFAITYISIELLVLFCLFKV